MKKFIAFALVLAAFVPALAAQTAATFTGKWEGTFTRITTDGTPGSVDNVVFSLTQKGKALTGTAGPPDEQLNITNGAVNAGKATFEVQAPNGSLFKFALSIVKGRLQGDMTGERDGVVRGRAKVDAGPVKGK